MEHVSAFEPKRPRTPNRSRRRVIFASALVASAAVVSLFVSGRGEKTLDTYRRAYAEWTDSEPQFSPMLWQRKYDRTRMPRRHYRRLMREVTHLIERGEAAPWPRSPST